MVCKSYLECTITLINSTSWPHLLDVAHHVTVLGKVFASFCMNVHWNSLCTASTRLLYHLSVCPHFCVGMSLYEHFRYPCLSCLESHVFKMAVTWMPSSNLEHMKCQRSGQIYHIVLLRKAYYSSRVSRVCIASV